MSQIDVKFCRVVWKLLIKGNRRFPILRICFNKRCFCNFVEVSGSRAWKNGAGRDQGLSLLTPKVRENPPKIKYGVLEISMMVYWFLVVIKLEK